MLLTLALLLAADSPVGRDIILPDRLLAATWPRIYDAWVAEPQYAVAMVRGGSLVMLPKGTPCRVITIDRTTHPTSATIRLIRGPLAGKDLWVRESDLHPAPREPTP